MEQLQDIPKLYTAIAEFLSCLVIIAAYSGIDVVKKKPVQKIIALSLGFVSLIVIHYFCGLVSNILWLVGMTVAVSLMNILIKYILEISLSYAIYLGCKAFMFAELAAAFNWQIYYYYFVLGEYDTIVTRHLFCLVIYILFFVSFYKIEVELFPDELQKDNIVVTNKQLFTTILLTALFFVVSNLSYAEIETPFSGGGSGVEIFNIRTLIDLAGFVILEAIFIQKLEDDRKNELDVIKNILYMQYSQYRTSQENIDLINRKYHDLKHQLQIIKEENNQEKKNEYIDEIEEGIRKYEAENKTGNDVLDTILTSKSNVCLKHDIQLVSIVDGTLLKHIHVMDLCTIFGNALDNAIEYEIQLPEKEKRMIHVTVSEKQSMIAIVVENYCEEVVVKDNKIPLTSKKDKGYHGYGIKSIKYSIEKYDGFVNLTNNNNWFRVEMLLPKKN
ncbi:MAG: GHKL domain-containing protein [Butyrivibrio sp.]|nr:GHKL domain-containing protein [Butyrivibrio sp.]